MFSVRRPAVLGAGLALSLALAAPAAAHDDSVKVVASGLDNPRGITFGPGGDLYVAESGKGGSGPCVSGVGDDPDASVCYGATGAVTRVNPFGGGQERIATGLPSAAGAAGTEASGPSDISFPADRGYGHGGYGHGHGRKLRHHGHGESSGKGFLTVGLGADPAVRDQFGDVGAGFAQLYRFRADGSSRPVADLGAYEAANNPDSDQPDSAPDTNPNSVAAIDTRHAIVADAGGNDVLLANKRGDIKTLGVLPDSLQPAPDIPGFPVPPGTPIPTQAVPTSVALGHHGDIYVGQLTGFPFVPGAAGIWVIKPGQDPQPFVTGLTLVTDIAFDDEGNLYAVQISNDTLLGPPAPGSVVKITPDGEKTTVDTGDTVLNSPYGIAIRGHAAYVTTGATEPGTGAVVRIPLADDGDGQGGWGDGHHHGHGGHKS
jgi:hypothetical protein